MEAVVINKKIEKDGEIHIKGLAWKKGQEVEMIVLLKPAKQAGKAPLTGRDLSRSGIVGMWQKRRIKDGTTYSRRLRRLIEKR